MVFLKMEIYNAINKIFVYIYNMYLKKLKL